MENSAHADYSQPVKLYGQRDFADTDLLEILHFSETGMIIKADLKRASYWKPKPC